MAGPTGFVKLMSQLRKRLFSRDDAPDAHLGHTTATLEAAGTRGLPPPASLGLRDESGDLHRAALSAEATAARLKQAQPGTPEHDYLTGAARRHEAGGSVDGPHFNSDGQPVSAVARGLFAQRQQGPNMQNYEDVGPALREQHENTTGKIIDRLRKSDAPKSNGPN